jgi:hypothetical protein
LRKLITGACIAVLIGGCQTGLYRDTYTTFRPDGSKDKEIVINWGYGSLHPLKAESVSGSLKQNGGDIAVGAAAVGLDSTGVVTVPVEAFRAWFNPAATTSP